MAKKIRFSLEMENGTEVRELDELKDNFSLEKVLYYIDNGRMFTWLRDRYHDDVAEQIQELDKNDPDYNKKLCEIFEVEYDESAVEDMERAAERARKLALLKELTDDSNYAGVIVTAGSDTLAYLSAFVGLVLGGCALPVMIVAANKILTAPDSNGYENFCCAVELIKKGLRGVFVPYRNSDGVTYVHSATDLRQADLSEDFLSLHGAYGVYENGRFTSKRPYIGQRLPAVFGKENLPHISDNVLLLTPYPMQDYTRINTDGVRAVLHTLYHSATLDSPRAVGFVRELDVPFFIASVRAGQKPYATTKEIIEAGAVPLYDIAPECAYMKLLLACAQEKMSIQDFME